ncbi:MAG: phospholipase D-like domain-containing protein [Trichloromonadaceae bacterium]
MSNLSQGKYRFTWRKGNAFRLLIDGKVYLRAMLEAIENAHSFIFLEMYLWESGLVSDRFIAAFNAAAGRGVKVHLLLDDYGCYGLQKRDRLRLQGAGVAVVRYNPIRFHRWHRNLFRNHRKLLLVDGEVAFTGGTGLTDMFDPEVHPTRHWHEAMLELRGPVVWDWQRLFCETWEHWAGGPLYYPAVAAGPLPGTASGRLTTQGRAHARSEIMRSFITHIRNARYEIWMSTAYFVPPWKLRRALRRAAQRGVDVRLLLPGPRSDHPAVRYIGRRFYERLLRDGVRIFEYQPRFLHAKLLLCDQWVSIGSSNLDRWNYRWNLEANQETRGAKIVPEVRELFLSDMSLCREMDYASWQTRSRYRRLLEWFWGKVVSVVARATDGRSGKP